MKVFEAAIMKSQRSRIGRLVLSIVRQAILGLAACIWTTGALHAKPWFDSHACRQVTEAVMKGDVEAGIAAINPDASDRASAHDLLTRLTDSLGGFFKGKKPRLERTLPDISVENYPTSLQIWSFGDVEVHFVGCLMRPGQKKVQILLQVHPSVDQLVQQMKVKLKGN